MKSGNLNYLEPSGSIQTRNGTDLPLPIHRHRLWRGDSGAKSESVTALCYGTGCFITCAWRKLTACGAGSTGNSDIRAYLLHLFPSDATNTQPWVSVQCGPHERNEVLPHFALRYSDTYCRKWPCVATGRSYSVYEASLIWGHPNKGLSLFKLMNCYHTTRLKDVDFPTTFSFPLFK